MRAHRGAQHLGRPAGGRSGRAENAPHAGSSAAAQHAADVSRVLQAIEIDGVVVQLRGQMRSGQRDDRQQPRSVLDAARAVEQAVFEDDRLPAIAHRPGADPGVGDAAPGDEHFDRFGVAPEAPGPGLQQVNAFEHDDAGARALARRADEGEQPPVARVRRRGDDAWRVLSHPQSSSVRPQLSSGSSLSAPAANRPARKDSTGDMVSSDRTSSARTGAKLRRCTTHGPFSCSIRRCSGVP